MIYQQTPGKVYENKAASSEGSDLSLVTTGEKYNWNNKSNFSGSYTDLTNKPTIPVMSSTTGTITTTGWSNNSLTINVTGVTASNAVIVTPAPSSLDEYASCKIKCTAQASGTLTFECEEVPTNSLTVNVLIYG